MDGRRSQNPFLIKDLPVKKPINGRRTRRYSPAPYSVAREYSNIAERRAMSAPLPSGQGADSDRPEEEVDAPAGEEFAFAGRNPFQGGGIGRSLSRTEEKPATVPQPAFVAVDPRPAAASRRRLRQHRCYSKG